MENMEIKSLFGSVFKNKKVLVTGHTGFKGSWLSLWLKELGADVIGCGLDPYTPKDNFVLCELSKKMVDIRQDIRDLDSLKSIFNKHNPEIVFHLAAQPLVRLSYDQPHETYETNVMGTINVLECIRQNKSVKTAVIITSDKCYENKERVQGYREDEPMGGFDPYSSSKGCAELVTAAYRNSFFSSASSAAISSARAGNVIGGGDWALDRLIPDCINALEQDKPVVIRKPSAVRPWQHVLEPLSGYLLLASKMVSDPKSFNQAWNFGPEPNTQTTVKELVQLILKNYGKGKAQYGENQKNPHEAGLLSLDITKARTKLNWHPVLNLAETIGFTIDWYKKYAQENVYNLCLTQIHAYINKEQELNK
ncbi:CDP-glucose 4,6-dehydratase [Candidatus Margulisiibacteriota bacterium]